MNWQYKIKPGKMSEWLDFMENEIIPFQVSKGAVISASFKGEADDSGLLLDTPV